MQSKELIFRIGLRPELEGGYTIIVPYLPGCITYGDGLEEVKKMTEDAIKVYPESMKKHKGKPGITEKPYEGMLT